MYLKLLYITLISVLLFSCANQLPPSGGEDDILPPKLVSAKPKPNSVNFQGNSLKLRFDEYIDRRSLIDAVIISNVSAEDIEFDIGGKEAEIIFRKPLSKNTTYGVYIGKSFRDIRGNYLKEPISFAFSTGDKIQSGKISGRVFSPNYDRLYVLAYKLYSETDTSANPEKKKAGFIVPTDDKGNYTVSYLPSGRYRLFALYDSDKNFLYDKGFDLISVLPSDIEIEENASVSGYNFLMNNLVTLSYDLRSGTFVKSLSADSLNRVYSNIGSSIGVFPENSKFVFYFKNNNTPRDYISEKFTFTDSTGKNIRTVKNWVNDSLMEVIPSGFLNFDMRYKINISLKLNSGIYNVNYEFRTITEEKSGSVSGLISVGDELKKNMILKIINVDYPVFNYTHIKSSDSVFVFEGLLGGRYYLFSFEDRNSDRKFDYGNPFPYAPSEKFFISDILNLKAGWKIENLIVSF